MKNAIGLRGIYLKILLVLGSIIAPLLMFVLQRRSNKARVIFSALAVIAALIFGNITSIAIYEVITDDTVFMTTIHKIFLNPYFIITGVFVLYLLLLLTVKYAKEQKR